MTKQKKLFPKSPKDQFVQFQLRDNGCYSVYNRYALFMGSIHFAYDLDAYAFFPSELTSFTAGVLYQIIGKIEELNENGR
jgi:hypothetical protein